MRLLYGIVVLAAAGLPCMARKFYADDPLPSEPRPRDASQAARRKISDYYDFFQQSFAAPGGKHTAGQPIPAGGVNTLGEPMDGAWYAHRHYFHPMTTEELVRGAGDANPPSREGKWKVVRAKSEGVTPGFEILDARGRRYVLKFDPLDYPEIATAPDVLVSKFFHALGYHVPENYIVYFRPSDLELAGDVQLTDAQGKTRLMTRRDVIELLVNVPQTNGQFRAGASLYLPGKPLGPYKYFGTRRDDPNDTVPHEHLRSLRGLSVFAAWLGHDDSRSINSQDMLVTGGGVSSIRHHLIDFGSTLGSASGGPNSARSGFEYLFEWSPAIRQFLTLGFSVPYWAHAKYPNFPSVGRFESAIFDPERWKAEYPNPAFTNRLPDDAFWAAKQVMAFTDEQIRAIVRTGRFNDSRAEEWIAKCLIERRDKIGRGFFRHVLPLDRFAVEGARLTFVDLGALHKFDAARDVRVQWSMFDNESEWSTAIPGAASYEVPGDRVPRGGYLAAHLSAGDPKKAITVYVRNEDRGWRVVGVDRTW